ncbi:MAG TPA: T9SS type A sorting domain-containing protein [candidate division Zixibacteria bacterium]|nr:T9SS type A sorting domain-containing protein [candidate division Zixibacteria bacterium]
MDIQVTVAGVPSLAAPSYLSYENFSNSQQRVRLGWDDLNFFDSGWVVERKPTSSSTWVEIDSLPRNETGTVVYEDTTATGSQAYDYRVKPFGLDNSQDRYSPIATVTTLPRWPDSAVAEATETTNSCGPGVLGGTMVGGEEMVSQSSGGGGGENPFPDPTVKTDQIVVSWAPPSNQNPAVPIAHYRVQRIDVSEPVVQGPVWDSVTDFSLTVCGNENSTSYPFRIWAVDINGDTSLSYTTPPAVTGCYDICAVNPPARIVGDGPILPERTEVFGNFPNPFNPSTQISFALANPGVVRLTVYNLLGQVVTTLVDREFRAGTHTVRWNGRDAHGSAVSSGVYLYRFEADGVVANRKMMLVK